MRAIVESTVAPMISTFQGDLMKLIDGIVTKLSGEEQTPQTFHINVDASCAPGKKTITTSRDAQGNLQATVVPEEQR